VSSQNKEFLRCGRGGLTAKLDSNRPEARPDIEEEDMFPYLPVELVGEHIRETRTQAASARLRAAARAASHDRPSRHRTAVTAMRWIVRRA
jgi:hypothetical protein